MATVRSLSVNVRADTSQFQRAMEQVRNTMKNTGSQIKNIGMTLTKSLTVPIVGLGTAVVKSAADFESAMSEVKAVTGAAGTQFDILREKAREMGRRTSKTAVEAAQAIKFMGVAGWNTTQIMEGLEPILRLSEASAMDLGQTSDLVTDAMASLGLKTSEMGSFLDMMAKASNKSNTEIGMLLEALILTGGSVKNLNIPLEEVISLLGVMASRGAKGAEAGRGLNSILTNLSTGAGQAGEAMADLNFSAFDAEGNFKGLSVVLIRQEVICTPGAMRSGPVLRSKIGPRLLF